MFKNLKMLNKELQAETKDDSEPKPIATTSSPNAAKPNVMCRKYYCVSVFDSSLKKYGGFNHFIAGKIFRWKLCYLDIYFKKQFKFEIIHNDEEYYYDGYHNHVWIGWVLVSYGT